MNDRAKYLEIFKSEADEHISSLRDGLLVLETKPGDADLLERVLRNAHTLKGTSRMMGFLEIGEVAHKMEDVIKAGEKDASRFNDDAISLLLSGVDYMQGVLDAIGAGAPTPPVPADLLAQLEGALATDRRDAGNPEPEPPPSPPGDAAPPASPPGAGEGLSTDLKASLEAILSGGAPSAPVPDPTPAAEPPPPSTPEPIRPPAPAPPTSPTIEATGPFGARPKTARREKKSATSVLINLDKNINTIRVDVPILDKLTDLVGELAIARAKLDNKMHLTRNLAREVESLGDVSLQARLQNGDWKQVTADLALRIQEFVQSAVEELDVMSNLLGDIQEQTLRMRMLPLSLIFDDFYRVVREQSRRTGKDVKLEIEGGDTRLDKKVLEDLVSPLIHMVTNAVDHGIEPPDFREARGKPETGTIRIRASSKGDHAHIEVYDDGRGLDPAALRHSAAQKGILSWEEAADLDDVRSMHLIFRSGFSTRTEVSGTSGRGVGMDVVKKKLEALKANIRIESRYGEFTRFTLTLPLNYSVLQGLLVDCDGEVAVIPVDFVKETLHLDRSRIVRQGERYLMPHKDAAVPLIELGDILRFRDGEGLEADRLNVVVLSCRGDRLGLVVDRILRREEVVVKSAGEFIKGMRLVSGATILRLGDPAIILNIFDLFDASRGLSGHLRPEVSRQRQPRVLVVDDSVTSRTVEGGVLERAGYLVDLATDGEQGLAKARARQYDLVVTDVEMPRRDGFELTAALRADPRTRSIPVVIVTSRTEDSERRRGVEVGAQAYITKGTFDQNVLVETVRRLIG